MPLSSSSTTPTLISRSMPRSCASSGTPARRASRRTGCSSRTGSTTTSSSAFTAAVEALKVADGFTEGVQVGPLIDEPAVEKVERHVADALDAGRRARARRRADRGAVLPPVGPHRRDDGDGDELRGDVRPGRRHQPVRDRRRGDRDRERHALRARGVLLTTDLARTWRVAEALEYGIVGINTGFISTEVAPFGGVKESGIGREGSSYGVDDWVELKYLAMGGIGEAI